MNENIQKRYEENIKKTNRWTFRILVLGLLSLATPWLFTAFEAPFSSLDFTQTGQIGDTIGGITAPFLSLVGSFLVFLSFRAQIEMNRIQFIAIQKQFQKMDEDKLKERFSEMQNVINIINEQYLGLLKVDFHPFGRHSNGYDGLFRSLNNAIEFCSRGDKDKGLKSLEEAYIVSRKFDVLIHLSSLLQEYSKTKGLEYFNFILIQSDIILNHIQFFSASDKILDLLSNLEVFLEGENYHLKKIREMLDELGFFAHMINRDVRPIVNKYIK